MRSSGRSPEARQNPAVERVLVGLAGPGGQRTSAHGAFGEPGLAVLAQPDAAAVWVEPGASRHVHFGRAKEAGGVRLRREGGGRGPVPAVGSRVPGLPATGGQLPHPTEPPSGWRHSVSPTGRTVRPGSSP